MNIAAEQIPSLFIGTQGIKTVFVGSTPVYERPGGYVYLTLNTEPKDPQPENSK